MDDREKVIKGLQICHINMICEEECPYYDSEETENDFCLKILHADAIELLKEQEAVKPKCKERMGGFVTGLCPTCGTALNNIHNVKACGKCGQAVKWDA